MNEEQLTSEQKEENKLKLPSEDKFFSIIYRILQIYFWIVISLTVLAVLGCAILLWIECVEDNLIWIPIVYTSVIVIVLIMFLILFRWVINPRLPTSGDGYE